MLSIHSSIDVGISFTAYVVFLQKESFLFPLVKPEDDAMDIIERMPACKWQHKLIMINSYISLTGKQIIIPVILRSKCTTPIWPESLTSDIIIISFILIISYL